MVRRTVEVVRKFIAGADFHMPDSESKPKYRKDNYWETAQRKLNWIVDLANAENAALLIAGDLFETSRVSHDTLNTVTSILKKLTRVPLVVAGQHDQTHHLEELYDTPLYNLMLNGNVIMLSDRPMHGIYGQSYGQKIPWVDGIGTYIIVAHRGITPDEPPFFLSDMISAEDAAKEYAQFRLLISGDYHSGYHKNIGEFDIVNCGPMLRSKKDQRGMKPCVWLIEIGDTIKVTQKFIPIAPPEEVFDIAAIEYDEINSIKIDTTKLRALLNTKQDTVKFQDIVWYNFEETEFKRLTEKDVKQLLAVGGM